MKIYKIYEYNNMKIKIYKYEIYNYVSQNDNQLIVLNCLKQK